MLDPVSVEKGSVTSFHFFPALGFVQDVADSAQGSKLALTVVVADFSVPTVTTWKVLGLFQKLSWGGTGTFLSCGGRVFC